MRATTGGRLFDEPAAVWCKRYAEALDAGMSERDAEWFADSTVDVAELRRLLELRCPSDKLAAILR